jgi:hypothetical protein
MIPAATRYAAVAASRYGARVTSSRIVATAFVAENEGILGGEGAVETEGVGVGVGLGVGVATG